MRTIIPVLIIILQIAVCVVPVVLCAAIFLRSRDSYRDAYERSSFKSMGISFQRYRNYFRIAGVLLLIFGLSMFFWLYLYKPSDPNAEIRDFWESLEKEKKDDFIFNSSLKLQ